MVETADSEGTVLPASTKLRDLVADLKRIVEAADVYADDMDGFAILYDIKLAGEAAELRESAANVRRAFFLDSLSGRRLP